jgi:hypothetical protein
MRPLAILNRTSARYFYQVPRYVASEFLAHPAFQNKSRSGRLVTNFAVLEGFEGYDPGLFLNPLLCVSVRASRAVGLIADGTRR